MLIFISFKIHYNSLRQDINYHAGDYGTNLVQDNVVYDNIWSTIEFGVGYEFHPGTNNFIYNIIGGNIARMDLSAKTAEEVLGHHGVYTVYLTAPPPAVDPVREQRARVGKIRENLVSKDH